jgi:hypothetical protein
MNGVRKSMRRFICAGLFALLLGSPCSLLAANCVAVASGNWNASATWGAAGCAGAAGGIPGAGDTVTIIGGLTVTIPAGYTAAASWIDVGQTTDSNSNTLTLAASTSALNIGSGAGCQAGVALCVNRPGGNNTNTLSVGPGIVTVAGSAFLGGTTNPGNRLSKITITTGRMSVSGNLTIRTGLAAGAAVATIDMTGGAGIFDLAGALNLTDGFGTLSSSATSKFDFNGSTAAQTVPLGISAFIYSNLYVNNTNAGGATLGAAVTTSNVTGDLRIGIDPATGGAASGAILSDAGLAIAGNAGKTFQIGAGSTFKTTLEPQSITGFTIDLGTVSPCGTYEYAASTAQTIAAANYGVLKSSSSGARTLASSGTIGVACGFTPGTNGYTVTGSTVNFNGSGSETIPAFNYNNLTSSSTGARTLASSGTVGVAGVFTPGTNAYTITGSTVDFNGTGAQTVPAFNYNNLTISQARTTNSVTLASSGTIGVAGAFTPSATFTSGGFVVTGSTVAYNGTSAQTMGAFTYNGLTISNSSGVSLTASPTVNGTLTFTSGTLSTGANKVTIGASGGTSGAGTSQHVVGNLEKVYTAAGSFTYAVGDGTNYTPAALNFTTLSTTGNLTVSVNNAAHPNTTSGTDGIDINKDINRYWTVKNPTLTGTYTATSTYINGSPVDRASGVTVSGVNLPNVIVRKGTSCSGSGGSRTCSTWGGTTLSGTPTTTQATASGISIVNGAAESDLAVGEPTSSNFTRERQFIFTREQY